MIQRGIRVEMLMVLGDWGGGETRNKTIPRLYMRMNQAE